MPAQCGMVHAGLFLESAEAPGWCVVGSCVVVAQDGMALLTGHLGHVALCCCWLVPAVMWRRCVVWGAVPGSVEALLVLVPGSIEP